MQLNYTTSILALRPRSNNYCKNEMVENYDSQFLVSENLVAKQTTYKLKLAGFSFPLTHPIPHPLLRIYRKSPHSIINYASHSAFLAAPKEQFKGDCTIPKPESFTSMTVCTKISTNQSLLSHILWLTKH